MSPQSAARRRSRSRQDGVGAFAAVVGAGVAVAIVAGGGWAIARSGNSDSASAADTSTTTASPQSHSPHATAHPTEHRAWSDACDKAATAATHDGYGVMAPSELPAVWSLRSCRYSTAHGWHMEVRTGHDTLSVDQRQGDVAAVLDSVLGSNAHQGKDVHAAGTGTWQSWAGAGGKNALSRALSSSGVVISGQVSVPTLNRLASRLLTYENAPQGNNGG